MKKIVLSLILASSIWGIFHSCCGDPIIPYWGIADYSISMKGDNNTEPVNDTLFSETLSLHLSITPEFISQIIGTSLLNTAFATSCPRDGDHGMKDPIVRLNVTSDSIFNGITAGDLLNPIISVGDVITPSGQMTPAQYLTYLSTTPYTFIGGSDSFVVTINNKPQNQPVHRFTIELEFQSGKIIQNQSDRITWL